MSCSFSCSYLVPLRGWPGLLTRVKAENGGVFSRVTRWSFLIWACLVALLQLTNLLLNVSPEFLVLCLALQTGIMALHNLTLAVRSSRAVKTA